MKAILIIFTVSIVLLSSKMGFSEVTSAGQATPEHAYRDLDCDGFDDNAELALRSSFLAEITSTHKPADKTETRSPGVKRESHRATVKVRGKNDKEAFERRVRSLGGMSAVCGRYLTNHAVGTADKDNSNTDCPGGVCVPH